MFFGIIVEQSLADKTIIEQFDLRATRRGREWTYHLVSLDADTFPGKIARLMAAMARDDYWYAHFFREDELIVVYRDSLYYCSTDPASWQAAIDQGLKNGIPLSQLDFYPRDIPGVQRFFSLDALAI